MSCSGCWLAGAFHQDGESGGLACIPRHRGPDSRGGDHGPARHLLHSGVRAPYHYGCSRDCWHQVASASEIRPARCFFYRLVFTYPAMILLQILESSSIFKSSKCHAVQQQPVDLHTLL